MARRSVTLSDLARSAVLRTGDWPGVGGVYRGIYRLQAERTRAALSRLPGVRGAWLRGSNAERIQPGLSDIDLVVLLENGTGAERLTWLEALFSAVRRVNRGAPLIRDVHAGTEAAFLSHAELATGLHAAIAHDSTPLVGLGTLPIAEATPACVRGTLLREAWYWSARALQQVVTRGSVARALAARSHAKALAALGAAEQSTTDLAILARAYAEKRVAPLDARGALTLLGRAEALLPDAPLLAPEEASPHPGVAAAADEVRRRTAELTRGPAVESVVLSVEGAREGDLRCYVVLDPHHPGGLDALERVGDLARRGRFPRSGFSRFATPLVVTRRALERSVFLRHTALEPVARGRHATVLVGAPVSARATPEELRRAVALELGTAALRASELVARPLAPEDERTVAELSDLAWGLAPAARALARTGEIRTRYAVEAPEDPAARDALVRSSRRFRVELLETLETLLHRDFALLTGSPGPHE